MLTREQMEELIKILNQRLTTVEQIVPTVATKLDLERFATRHDLEYHFASKHDLEQLATKADLRSERTRTDILIESVRDDVRLVADGVASLTQRLERNGII